MNKIIITTLIIGLFLIGSVSAISVDYYFNPKCVHCEKIKPFMTSISNYFHIKWIDTSEPKSYPITGTPTAIVHASDGREVKLTGSYEISKYLACELNEQSTKECMTYSYLNCTTNSYFVRE